MARVGIFGGSFNPVHNGHLHVARLVCDARSLDRLMFVPAGRPPHKSGGGIADGRHRLAMLGLAADCDPRFEVCDLELRRGGKSYTLLTVRELRSELDTSAELFLVAGGDMLADIPNWWHADELVREVAIIGTGRPGNDLQSALAAFCAHVPHDVCARTRELAVPMPPMDVSATEIRRRVPEGSDIQGLVPDAVRDYIKSHRLYEEGEG